MGVLKPTCGTLSRIQRHQQLVADPGCCGICTEASPKRALQIRERAGPLGPSCIQPQLWGIRPVLFALLPFGAHAVPPLPRRCLPALCLGPMVAIEDPATVRRGKTPQLGVVVITTPATTKQYISQTAAVAEAKSAELQETPAFCIHEP